MLSLLWLSVAKTVGYTYPMNPEYFVFLSELWNCVFSQIYVSRLNWIKTIEHNLMKYKQGRRRIFHSQTHSTFYYNMTINFETRYFLICFQNRVLECHTRGFLITKAAVAQNVKVEKNSSSSDLTILPAEREKYSSSHFLATANFFAIRASQWPNCYEMYTCVFWRLGLTDKDVYRNDANFSTQLIPNKKETPKKRL